MNCLDKLEVFIFTSKCVSPSLIWHAAIGIHKAQTSECLCSVINIHPHTEINNNINVKQSSSVNNPININCHVLSNYVRFQLVMFSLAFIRNRCDIECNILFWVVKTICHDNNFTYFALSGQPSHVLKWSRYFHPFLHLFLSWLSYSCLNQSLNSAEIPVTAFQISAVEREASSNLTLECGWSHTERNRVSLEELIWKVLRLFTD